MRETGQKATGGTCTHIAPEKWKDINLRGNEAYDVYAMGIVVWEVFTEEVPYSGNTSFSFEYLVNWTRGLQTLAH